LRSAFARLALVLPEPEDAIAPLPELVAPAVEPEFMEPEAPVLPVLPVLPAVLAAALPAVEPCAAAPPPPGVPVVPMGVPCVLRCPAPVAGLAAAGLGGVPWAIARLTVAAATAAAARILKVDIVQDSFVWDLL
jgi:hypothetical protein